MRLLLLLVVLPTLSFADVIISNEADCVGKDAGVACDSWTIPEKQGVCLPAKCSRKDYSEGIPPKTKSVDCLKCLPVARDGGVHTGYGTSKKGTTK